MRSLNPAALTTEIAILAGGLSSRMGRNKGRLRLGKRTLLGHVRATAERSRLPVRIIRQDLVPRCGPLGGIYTALKTSRKQLILFLPCDTPFVSLALLERVLNSLRPDDAAVFVAAHKRVSFPFLLRRNCLSVVEKQLTKKRYSLQTLSAALRAKKIPLSPGEEMDLFNINTPQEWEIARRRTEADPDHRQKWLPEGPLDS